MIPRRCRWKHRHLYPRLYDAAGSPTDHEELSHHRRGDLQLYPMSQPDDEYGNKDEEVHQPEL